MYRPVAARAARPLVRRGPVVYWTLLSRVNSHVGAGKKDCSLVVTSQVQAVNNDDARIGLFQI